MDSFNGCRLLLGHIEILKALLANNSNVDLQDNTCGRIALILACKEGYVECARLLLEKGAEMTIKNKYGATSKDIAQEKRRLNIINIIAEVYV